MTDTDIPPAVYGMARRAFITEMDGQNMAATVDTLQYSTEQYRPGPYLKAEVLDRVTSLTRAEVDLRKLLRPDLDEADVAETLARWMLYIAGASIDVEKAIKAMLTSAIPEIEKAFAERVRLELVAHASSLRVLRPNNAVELDTHAYSEQRGWFAAANVVLKAAGMTYIGEREASHDG
jgi:hypothetical protein